MASIIVNHAYALEFVPLDMLNRNHCSGGTDECDWFDVHRYCGSAGVPDQRICVQSEKLEKRPIVAGDRGGAHRALDLHGQAVGEFIAMIRSNGYPS